MMKWRTAIILLCLSLMSSYSYAQYYNTGQDPGSLKWMQINTGRFRVIYPESFGERGADFARKLDKAYSELLTRYPDRKFRLPVVIHNYTTESNGYVAWAPSRMEVYPTPEQNTIPLDPDVQLAVHEMTHVFQMESLNTGFTRAMTLIAGQQFPGLVASLVPLWFLEGDAVFSESLLTNSGRGRAPSFQKQFKALAVEQGKIYKYDKIINGSFRDFVPDHYHSGYQITAWSYAKYDTEIWKKALRLTAGAPFLFNPVNLSLRSNASMTKKKLYLEAFDSLKAIWKAEDIRYEGKNYEPVNPAKKKDYVNYYSPVFGGPDSVFAVKTTLYDIPSFVLIRPSSRSEIKIHVPGYCYPWVISYGGGNLVWVENHSDPRWENREWSVIRILDVKRGSVRQLSQRTRYLAASVSPGGKSIAAVKNSVNNKNYLLIIDSRDGNVLKEIQSPSNAYLQKPQWDESGQKITFISLTANGEGIILYDVEAGEWSTLVEPSNNDLQSSFFRNDSLFYISSSTGTDNIHLRSRGGETVLLTRSRFGASDLDVSGNRLLFADYTSGGNNICLTAIGSGQDVQDVQDKSSFLINRFKPAAAISRLPEDKLYTPKPYRKWQHLFRFHSWMPFYTDVNEIKADPGLISPGVTLLTQNDLSTLISTFGYEYSNYRHQFHSGIKWLGWYLVFESQFNYGARPVVIKKTQDIPDPVNLSQGLSMTNSISLPLSYYGNTFSQYLYLTASSTLTNDHIYLSNRGKYDSGQNQLTGRIYFSNYYRKAVRDIYPRWAQYFDLTVTGYPFDADLYGSMVTAKSTFFFPGLLKNNVIRLRLEEEKQKFISSELGVSHFYNQADFPRSFNDIISKQLTSLSADYHFPIAYPDFNLASLLYLKRIRANGFYDFARGTGNYELQSTDQGVKWVYNDGAENFRSFGAELFSDFYLLRIPYMISAGVQAAWRDLGEAPYLKFLFNIDIYGMSIGRRRNR